MNNKKNRILAVFFIAFFAVNIILPSLVLVHFKVNQEYISANLCVEKDLEESTCDGHCQLKKSLDVIEHGSSNKEDVKFNVESHISFLYAPIVSHLESTIFVNKKEYIKAENQNPFSGFYVIPFRPPILL